MVYDVRKFKRNKPGQLDEPDSPLRLLPTSETSIQSLAYHPELNNIVFIGYSSIINVYNSFTGELMQTLRHPEKLRGVVGMFFFAMSIPSRTGSIRHRLASLGDRIVFFWVVEIKMSSDNTDLNITIVRDMKPQMTAIGGGCKSDASECLADVYVCELTNMLLLCPVD